MNKILLALSLLLILIPNAAHAATTVVSTAAQCTGSGMQVRPYCCSTALTSPTAVQTECINRGLAESCTGEYPTKPQQVLLCMSANTPPQGSISPGGTPSPSAQTTEGAPFQPIVPVKGITDKNLTFPEYINQLFKISISLGAILAVLMIVWGGFEYMTSASGITKK